jgi:hypothetical protein
MVLMGCRHPLGNSALALPYSRRLERRRGGSSREVPETYPHWALSPFRPGSPHAPRATGSGVGTTRPDRTSGVARRPTDTQTSEPPDHHRWRRSRRLFLQGPGLGHPSGRVGGVEGAGPGEHPEDERLQRARTPGRRCPGRMAVGSSSRPLRPVAGDELVAMGSGEHLGQGPPPQPGSPSSPAVAPCEQAPSRPLAARQAFPADRMPPPKGR